MTTVTPADLEPRSAAATVPPHVLQIGMLWGQGGTAGGLDRIYTDLINQLPTQGFRVTGLVRGPEDVELLSAGRVRSFTPPGASKLMRYLGARRAIVDALRHRRVNLVASHFAFYAAVALDRFGDLPMVVHFHGPWSGEAAEEGEPALAVRVKRAVERTVYRRADRVIVLSHAFGELAVREFGVLPERIRVVPGHVDLDRFASGETRAQARARLGWPEDRPILLAVRRLQRRMGLDRLIAAMTTVVRAVPDVLLHIGGTGPLAAPLQQAVRNAGLNRHVRFLGFVPDADLPFAYRAADLNLVPTVALEGFGLVAAEALAAGTPSLVTPIGGLPEVVAPLSPALVLASCEVGDIARGIIAALRGDTALPDAAACQLYAAGAFSLPTAAQRIALVYREMLPG